jgi:hypothetical protein
MRRVREGRKVNDSSNPVTGSRAGSRIGGEPIHVWPDWSLSFSGVRVWTPISTSSGKQAPSAT